MVGPPINAGTVVSLTLGLSNAAGAWTEIITSTAAEASWIQVAAYSASSAGRAPAILLDVGIGGAGAEVAVISGMQVGMVSTTGGLPWMPLRIPAGTRVAVRAQNSDTLPTSMGVTVCTAGAAPGTTPPPITSLSASPATLATSRGALVTTSGWTEVIAATPMPYRMLVLCIGGGGDPTYSSVEALHDLGVGAAGSEVVVARSVWGESSTESRNWRGGPTYAVGSWPAGTRVVARSNQGATNGYSVNVIGVP